MNYLTLRKFILKYYGLTDNDFSYYTGKKLPLKIAWVKHIYTHFACKYVGRNFNHIGEATHRSRAACYFSEKQFHSAMKTDIGFPKEISNLDAAIRNEFCL